MKVIQGLAGGALGMIGGLLVAFMFVGASGNAGASTAQAKEATDRPQTIRVAIPAQPAAG